MAIGSAGMTDPGSGRPDRPNVLVILLDDTGFAQLGCFGSDVATPHIDRLAAGGLRFNRFHVTALCSPTRAALLTGRNHHAVGMGFVPEVPMDFPGYSAHLPRTAATVAARAARRRLQHLRGRQVAPHPPLGDDRIGPVRPLAHRARVRALLRLPRGRHQPVGARPAGARQPARRPAPQRRRRLPPHRGPRRRGDPLPARSAAGDPAPSVLHVLRAGRDARPAPRDRGVDRALRRPRSTTGGRRGATASSPARSPPAWCPPAPSARRRPDWVRAWDSLSADERRLYARQMEVFAGFLTHTDAQIGRILDALDDLGVAR